MRFANSRLVGLSSATRMRSGTLFASWRSIFFRATACGPAASGVPVLEVERQSTEFIVAAEGEVIASEALPIALPSDIRMEFNVVWMAPEFSEVKKGDVIARFDDVQIQLDREASALNVAKSEFKLAGTERTGELEATRIDHESDRVDGEREISEAFEGADERLFSRNELIDILADIDYLDAESAEHFEELRSLLDVAGIEYTLNPRLVRGLDYYNRTVFEWVTDALGSQGAVCSGGRYDGLVEKLGGRPTPAVGWCGQKYTPSMVMPCSENRPSIHSVRA